MISSQRPWPLDHEAGQVNSKSMSYHIHWPIVAFKLLACRQIIDRQNPVRMQIVPAEHLDS